MYASKSYKRLQFTIYVYAYISLQKNAYIKMAFDIYADANLKWPNSKSFQFEMILAGIEHI